MIADVAEGHGWPMSVVNEKLGARGAVPDSWGGKCNLAYVACVHRLVDYVHINYERASTIPRILKGVHNKTSVIHWTPTSSFVRRQLYSKDLSRFRLSAAWATHPSVGAGLMYVRSSHVRS